MSSRTSRAGQLVTFDHGVNESAPFRQSKWWFIGGAVSVALVGSLSTRVGVRDLESSAAADLRGLLGALAAMSILALGLQLVLVGVLGNPSCPGRMLRPSSARPTLIAAGAAGLAAAVGAVIFIDSSQTFELQAALSVGVAVCASAASIPSRAILLGEERWRDLAVVAVSGASIRLVITASTLAGGGLLTSLAGIVVGEIGGAAVAVWMTSRSERVGQWPTDSWRHFRIGSAAATGLMVVVVLSSLSLGDMPEQQVESFNQSASLARQVFVLSFTVAFVFFPAMARLPIGSVLLRAHFHRALTITAGTAVTAAFLVVSLPQALLAVIGDDAVTSAAALRLLAVAFAGYGIAVVSLMQYVAHGSRFALCAWPLCLVMVGAQVTVNTAESLAWYAFATSVILLVLASMPALARVQPVLRPMQAPLPVPSDHPGEAITVVVPAFNPGPVVVDTIRTILDCFDQAGIAVAVIVVSDGSTDGSPQLIDDAALPRVIHLRHEQNRGKGATLRTGFLAATTPSVGFVDADGDLHPAQLVGMARVRQETGADIVFGSKRHDDSTVTASALRRIYSRAYELMIRRLFQLDISDTQTGIKLYSRPVLLATLPVLEESGFALDLKLFVAAQANGFVHYVEVPVNILRRGGSTISMRTVIEMIGHTLRIFWRAKITLHYLRAATVSEPVRSLS